MKFFETDLIKTALRLDDELFSNENCNIDSLNHKARQNYYDRNFDLSLSQITLASQLVERFHSYFHYEQSYVYTQLAEIYMAYGNIAKAIEYLDKAIFQDHLNFQAINKMIIAYYKLNKIDNYKYWQERAEKLGIVDVLTNYKPEFPTFNEFAVFATQNLSLRNDDEKLSYYIKNTHYHYNAMAHDNLDANEAEQAKTNFLKSLENLEQAHKSYHANAAKVYINRHLVYLSLGQNELAKNDLEKASNLDARLTESLKV